MKKHLGICCILIVLTGCNSAGKLEKKENGAETVQVSEEYSFESTTNSLVTRLVGAQDGAKKQSQSLSIASKLSKLEEKDIIKDSQETSAQTSIHGNLGETTSSSKEPGLEIDGRAKAAIKDLAQHLTIDIDGIAVVDYQKVTWGSSSLGCPKDGFAYSEVIIEGVRLTLEVEKKLFYYHGDSEAELFLCENVDNSTPGDNGYCDAGINSSESRAWFTESSTIDCEIPNLPDVCHSMSKNESDVDLGNSDSSGCPDEISTKLEAGKEGQEVLREVLLETLKQFDANGNGTLSESERNHALAVILKLLLAK